MRVVIISFDALEATLVERYNCLGIMQKEHGINDLDTYLHNRPKGFGGGEPITGEVYSSLITGIIPPKSYNDFINAFDMEGGTPTIFSFTDKIVCNNVPAAPLRIIGLVELFSGDRTFLKYFEKKISLEKAERIFYTNMSAMSAISDAIALSDGELIFLYFSEPDKLQHMYMDIEKNEPKYRKLYSFLEMRTREMIEAFKYIC